MTTSTLERSVAIGALELKRQYQTSMISALILAAVFHLCLVGAVLKWDDASGVTATPINVPGEPNRPQTLRPVSPPPMTPDPVTQRPGAPTVEPIVGAIPVPTPDEMVIEDPDIPTRAELASYNALSALPGLGEFAGDGGVGNNLTHGMVTDPGPEEFVPVDTMPVLVGMVRPEYPEVARLTKTEGAVWVQALIDVDGSVKKARISKPSGSNVGFEEAAITAAYANKYRPALQNNRPVAVWVTYKVQFKLSAGQ
ncbi:MAG: energy transducer TonB [Candidatus Zixiibacteriota bacterium]